MEPIRVAAVRYLNTLPLIEGLDKLPGLTLIPSAPSAIGAMLESGEADLGLVSLADAAGAVREPLALGVGMIGCDGPTLTVRVFSRVPLEEVKTLHADIESKTSVVLAGLVLGPMAGRNLPDVARLDPRTLPDSPSGWSTFDVQTMLLIGDKAITRRPPEAEFPHTLDLGEAWTARTRLPMVYALWMARADRWAGEADRARMALGAALLDRQRRHNATRLDWIATTHAGRFGWDDAQAREYVTRILRYNVDDRAKAGAQKFLNRAAEAGLLPARTLNWWDAGA